MKVETKKVGRIRISEHVRSSVKSGRWYIDIPADLSGNGKRKRQFFDNLAEAEEHAYSMVRVSTHIVCKSPEDQQIDMSFSEFLSIWFEEQERLIALKRKRENSVRKDPSYLKHLQNFFGSKYLQR